MSFNTVVSILTSIADNVGDWITAKKELQAVANAVHDLSDSIDAVLDKMEEEEGKEV